METFAKRLKELRGERTQAEIAEKLGMRPGTYSTYERGEREPSMETLIKMADYYNVSLDTLFGRDSVTDVFVKGMLIGQLVSLKKDIQNRIDDINQRLHDILNDI